MKQLRIDTNSSGAGASSAASVVSNALLKTFNRRESRGSRESRDSLAESLSEQMHLQMAIITMVIRHPFAFCAFLRFV